MARGDLGNDCRANLSIVRIDSNIPAAGKHYHPAKRGEKVPQILSILCKGSILNAAIGTPCFDALIKQEAFAGVCNKAIPRVATTRPDQESVCTDRRQLCSLSKIYFHAVFGCTAVSAPVRLPESCDIG